MSNKIRLETPVLSLIAPLLLATFLATALLLVTAPTAFANPEDSDSVAAGELTQLEGLLYKVFRHPDGYAALVAGRLPSDTPLPATFEIAVPAGVEIIWFGEVSGGARDVDITFPEPLTVRSENGFDIYTAVTNEHRIQVEYLLHEDPFLVADDGTHVYDLVYTPLHDAQSLIMAAYLSPGSTVTDPSFIQMESTVEDPLYGTQINNVTGGETYSLTLPYTPPASVARQGGANLNEGLLVTAGILAITFIAAGAVFFIARHRRTEVEAFEDEHEPEDENYEHEYEEDE
ncbi:MAG: hypothetical protein FWE48_01170 [Coriobacteriia bacterium]|nr:hypothetical protein [Coriobacteriia bacterium]MCL2745690.1 hypothetical protein [Coriobacteriia bacterium]MCL2870460.1 hypothetical protein [Coriobacteriia bacterium]